MPQGHGKYAPEYQRVLFKDLWYKDRDGEGVPDLPSPAPDCGVHRASFRFPWHVLQALLEKNSHTKARCGQHVVRLVCPPESKTNGLVLFFMPHWGATIFHFPFAIEKVDWPLGRMLRDASDTKDPRRGLFGIPVQIYHVLGAYKKSAALQAPRRGQHFVPLV